MSILSATEAWKSVISKRITKGAVLKLDSDEPWDTVQAQLLVKIDQVLHPLLIKYEHYDVTFSIPWVYPKPGLSLNSAVDYDLIVKRHNPKAFTVNIMVVQLRLDDDKENEAEIELAKEKATKKSVQNVISINEIYSYFLQTRKDPATLPGNINKNRYIQELHDEHKCTKKDGVCPGTYCFDNPNGNHIILSHAHIDCWASAMVCS